MQQKAGKEAWRPKCAAPKLVYDSAIFFETFMHVYVLHAMHDQKFSAKTPPGVEKSRDRQVEHVCKTFRAIS